MGTNAKTKVYGIEVSFLQDPGAFGFWYEKMPSYRREKIDAMKVEKGKLLSLGAGILLNKGLEEFGAKEAEIAFSENKKPYILNGADSLYFNLSHSGSMAVCAFSDSEVGIDIEKNKVFKDNLIKYVFDKREAEFIRGIAADESEMNALFTSLWTMKESIMKFSGKGISMMPGTIYVELENEGGLRAGSLYHKGEKLENMRLTTYVVPGLEDYQICVCSEYDSFSEAVEMFKAP